MRNSDTRGECGVALHDGRTWIEPECAELSPLGRVEELEDLVESVVASWNASQPVFQKRRWHRVAYPRQFVITPLEERSFEQSEPSLLVQGCDISLGGISFLHAKPLSCRMVAVTLHSESGETDSIVTRLSWCRFMRTGMYRSGGRFVRTTHAAFAPEAHWSELAPG